MRHWVMSALCSTMLSVMNAASAEAEVGKPAPAFAATDTTGKPVSLADFKGKFLVLEWTHPECPFVGKHYDGGNIPSTQKEAIAKGAAWVSIQTTGKEGRGDLLAWQKSKGASPTATIVDSDGKLARAYRATATPHLFIVDPKGVVIYAGAIDSKPGLSPQDIKTATNYVSQALGEAMAGKPVSRANTPAYGCSVKYPSGA